MIFCKSEPHDSRHGDADQQVSINTVDNILGITNTIDPTRDNTNGNKKLGGAFKHSYTYNDLNRLAPANGKTKHVFV